MNTLRGHYGHIWRRKWPLPGAVVAMREAEALRMGLGWGFQAVTERTEAEETNIPTFWLPSLNYSKMVIYSLFSPENIYPVTPYSVDILYHVPFELSLVPKIVKISPL